MNDLLSAWEAHRDDNWPRFSSPHEGELMTLDTVISGCVIYFLENSEGLDLQRLEMLETCLADLDGLLPELPQDSRHYFERLRTMGGFLLDAQSAP